LINLIVLGKVGSPIAAQTQLEIDGEMVMAALKLLFLAENSGRKPQLL
jgi:hypothetical protein